MDTQNDALSKVSLFKRGDFGYLYLHQPVSLKILNPKLWKHRTLVMIPRKGHQNQQWSWHPTTYQGFLGFAMLIYRYMDGSYSNRIRFCNALQISGFGGDFKYSHTSGNDTTWPAYVSIGWFNRWVVICMVWIVSSHGKWSKKRETKFSAGSTHLFLHPQRST